MFELIGLVFATGILFALATVLSFVLAGFTWLSVRNRQAPRKRLVLAAALIPILSAAYLWLCTALLPGKSLFGDISQPLPNGYTLEALGKMPDFASLTSAKSPNSYNGLTECIGKLAVYGPFVVGQYSHPFGTFDPKPNEPFFVFDTRNHQHVDLPTIAELENSLGHTVQLTEVQFFRSQEPAYRMQQKVNRTVEFGPPIFALVILMAFVLHSRLRTLPPSQTSILK
jgi:hypothetical protein